MLVSVLAMSNRPARMVNIVCAAVAISLQVNSNRYMDYLSFWVWLFFISSLAVFFLFPAARSLISKMQIPNKTPTTTPAPNTNT
jgi:hypothetical protein